jgi:hypothetical protein
MLLPNEVSENASGNVDFFFAGNSSLIMASPRLFGALVALAATSEPLALTDTPP